MARMMIPAHLSRFYRCAPVQSQGLVTLPAAVRLEDIQGGGVITDQNDFLFSIPVERSKQLIESNELA